MLTTAQQKSSKSIFRAFVWYKNLRSYLLWFTDQIYVRLIQKP